MPRRNGLDQSTFFHVFCRGADRQDIFTRDDDQLRFERLLADVVADGLFRLHAYALMSNHYHLLVEAEGPALSSAMCRINRTYAVVFNDVSERSGPLFDQRFGAIPIVDDEMLMVEGRYVHRNPIDIVGADRLVNYRFSSFGAYVGARPAPDWLTTGHLMEPFSGDADRYHSFVVRQLESDTQWHGSRPPLRHLTMDGLVAVAAAVTDQRVEDLLTARSGTRNDGRSVLAMLAVELRLGSAAEIARSLGFGSAQAIRNCASKGRARVAREPGYARLRMRILEAAALT